MAQKATVRRRIGTLTTITAAAVLLAASLGTAQSDGARASEPPAAWEEDRLPTIEDSAKLDEPVIAQGRVVTEDGTAIPGARVILEAWPSQQTQASLKVGDRVPLIPIAKATSDEDGNYELRIPPSARLARLASTDDVINFEITALSEFGGTSHVFAVTPIGEAAGNRFASADAESGDEPSSDDRIPTSVDLAVTTSAEGDQTDPIGPLAQESPTSEAEVLDEGDEDIPAGPPTDVEPVDPDPAGYCSTEVFADYGERWVNVGHSIIATNGVSSRFTYTADARTTLGRGISATGAYGSWSLNNQVTWGSGATIGFPTQGSNTNTQYFDTLFSYRGIKKYCTSPGYPRYYAEPYRHYGGVQVRPYAGATSASYCVPQPAGSHHTQDYTIAVTWSNGVKIGGAIGIDLTSRTGFTTAAKITYWFTYSRRMCGKYGPPADGPGILVAKL